MNRRFIKVAGKGAVPAGAMTAVDVEGVPVALCNVDGEFFAVHDECTHECFPLSEGSLDGAELTCALHGARFDVRSGEVLALPAYGPVKTYPVEIDGEDILIAMDA